MAQSKPPKVQIESEVQESAVAQAGKETAKAANAPASASPQQEKASSQTASASEAASNAPKQEPTPTEAGGKRLSLSRLLSRFPGYEHTIICTLLGLIFALLVLIVGAQTTFFIAVCMFVGTLVGRYLDGDDRFEVAVRSLFKKNR